MGSTFKILGASPSFNFDYLNWILYFYKDAFKGNKKGAAIPHLNKDLFKSIIIGVPPYCEQVRIVCEIEKFNPLLTEYDRLEQQATTLDNEIYDKLKKSILQYAIQGKLVPQDKNDEPASVLLERIRAEKKANLGKKYVESYIYKGEDNCYYENNGENTNNLSSNLPFDIPLSWTWIRCKNCLLPMRSRKPQGDVFKYIDIDAIDNKLQVVSSPKIIKVENAPSRASREIREGDTLFSLVRPYLKNIAYIECDLSDCIASTGFYVCSPDKIIYPKYLYILLTSPYVIDSLMPFMKGDNSPSIRGENIEELLIPLPPYKEQIYIYNSYITIINKLKGKG